MYRCVNLTLENNSWADNSWIENSKAEIMLTHIIFQLEVELVGLASWRKKKPRPKTTPLGTTASTCNVYGKKGRRKRKRPVFRNLVGYHSYHMKYQLLKNPQLLTVTEYFRVILVGIWSNAYPRTCSHFLIFWILYHNM